MFAKLGPIAVMHREIERSANTMQIARDAAHGLFLRKALLLSSAVAGAFMYPTAALASFEYVTHWSTYNPSTGGTAFNGPTHVAFLKSNNNMLIVDSNAGVTGGGEVVIQAQDGTFVRKQAELDSQGPVRAAVDNNSGDVYIATYYESKLRHFTEAGGTLTLSHTWSGCTANGGFGPYTWSKLFGVAVDSTGAIYVNDYDGLRVIKLNSAGQCLAAPLTTYTKNSTAGQVFLNLTGVAVDSADNVWVADYGKKVVVQFDSTGTWQKTFTGFANCGSTTNFSSPKDIQIDTSNNDIFITDSGLFGTIKLNSNGDFLSKVTTYNTNTTFSVPFGSGLYGTGASAILWATDYGHSAVVKLKNPTRKVSVTASANGTVAADVGGVITGTTGGNTCVDQFVDASTVVLTATPSAGFATTWGGADGSGCSGNTCTLSSIGADKVVTATFASAGPFPSVSSSAPAGSPASNATSMSFTVTFSAAVSGVDATDFTLTKTGTADGTIGTPTTSDNIVWTVPITGITGSGTLRLDLKSSGTSIVATAAGNAAISGGFTSGSTHTVGSSSTTPTTTTPPPFVVSIPTDTPQTPITNPATVIQGAPAGTQVSDNGVVILPSPDSNGAPVTVMIAANTPNNAVIQLPLGAPTRFSVGGQTFTLSPGSGTTPVQVQTKSVTVTDSSGTHTVNSLQVIQGSVTLTGPTGQVLTAFGANTSAGCGSNVGYIIPLTSDAALSVAAGGAGSNSGILLTGHVDSGSATVHFSACAASGNVFSATGEDRVIYRGEQVAVDKGAQVASIVVRSASGSVGDAGDSLSSSLSIDGYRFAGLVPQLAKDTGRLQAGSTLQSRIAALVQERNSGLSFTGQNQVGALSFTVGTRETISALPVGTVTVQPGKADGFSVLSSGQQQITINETTTTFNSAPRDPARLIADLRSLDRNASVQVVADGSLRLYFSGRFLATQPAWSAVYDPANIGKTGFTPNIATANQFCHNAEGWQQCYYPVVNNFVALQAVVSKADPNGSVSEERSGRLTVKLLGNTYNLLPDWVVIPTPNMHASDDYWVDNGLFYIRSQDGYSQGLLVR